MKTKVFALFLAIAAMTVVPVTAHADQLSSPGVYWGSGNVNNDFTVLTTTEPDGSTLQLGISAITRFVGPIAPVPTTNDYVVSPGTSGGAALWDYVFSANTGTDQLSAYNWSVDIVNDLTHASFSYDPTLLPDNAQVGSFACHSCSTNLGNNGFQNSENLSFIPSNLFAFDPNAGGQWTFTFSGIPKNPLLGPDPSVSMNVYAMSPVPEPASLALFGTGLIGLAGLGLRKYHSMGNA